MNYFINYYRPVKFQIIIIFSYCLFFISQLSASLPSQPIASAKQLKTALLSLYQDNRHTFLCHEPFNDLAQHKHKICPKCQTIQSNIQWMPIVSFKQLAAPLRCYQEKTCLNKSAKIYKGVRCCVEQDAFFKMATRDLHNFVPEQKLVIGMRKHFAFGELLTVKEKNKECQLFTDDKKQIIYTPIALRGMVARTYLYMRDTYFLALSEEELSLYQSWHRLYPPSPWEKTKNEKIYSIQGNVNPYIK